MTSLHRAQAEAALEFYEHVLLADDSTDPVVQRDTAGASVEAANLQITIGRPDLAEPILSRATRLYERLLEADPDDPGLLSDLMVCRVKFGVMLMGRDPRRSIEALEAALVLAHRRRDRSDDGLRPSALDVAWCEHNLGSSWQIAQDPRRALPHYERAIDQYESVRRSGMGDVGVDVELAESLINAGLAEAQTGSLHAAEARYRRARTLLEAAIADRPDDRHILVTCCDLDVNLGNLETDLGQTELALEAFDSGLRVIEPLLRLAPDQERIRTTAINLHGARATALEAANRHAEAIPDWDAVIALDTETATTTTNHLRRLLCLARTGDHIAVVASVRSIEAREKLTPVDHYNLACALSLVLAAVPPGEARESLKTQAQASLDRACALDSSLLDQAKLDPDLQPLRP